MTKWRVTKTTRSGKRIATEMHWDGDKSGAIAYAMQTNNHERGANARVVKDSERVRRMIP
jgi:hypothetical protein